MPLYEYRCKQCRHAFEAYVRNYDLREVVRHCPKCSAASTYQGISQVRVGREQHFGLIMNDGSRVRGSLPKA